MDRKGANIPNPTTEISSVQEKGGRTRKLTAHIQPPGGQAGRFGTEYVAIRFQGVLVDYQIRMDRREAILYL